MVRKFNKYKLYKKYEIDFWGLLGPQSLIFDRKESNIFRKKRKRRLIKKINDKKKKILWKKNGHLIKNNLLLKRLINAIRNTNRYDFYFKINKNRKRRQIFWRNVNIRRFFIRNYLKNNYRKPKKLKNLLKNVFNLRSKKNFLKKRPFFFWQKEFNYQYTETNFLFLKKRKLSFKIKRYLDNIKIRVFYGGLRKKQIKRIYKAAFKYNNLFSKVLISKLEMRLDVLLFRLNIFESFHQIRQIISHKKILVNDVIINKKNYELNILDFLSIEKKKKKKFLKNYLNKLKYSYLYHNYPKYLEVEYDIMTCIILKNPETNEIPFSFYINNKNNLHMNSLIYNLKR